ncbi:hypothetical protein SprV_0401541900 [Sparganum proliferum]
MEQLQQRRLKQDETLNQLVQDLGRLTTVAFSSLGSADKDNTVLYYFIKALPSSDLSRSLLLQPPDDLQDAVTRAERYLRLCPSNSRPLPPEGVHDRDATLRSRDEVPFIPHDVLEAKLAHPSIVEEKRFAGQVDNCFPATTSVPVKGKRCLIYLDDVIVFGKTIAQHNDNLRAVLLALREAGLTLNP